MHFANWGEQNLEQLLNQKNPEPAELARVFTVVGEQLVEPLNVALEQFQGLIVNLGLGGRPKYTMFDADQRVQAISMELQCLLFYPKPRRVVSWKKW